MCRFFSILKKGWIKIPLIIITSILLLCAGIVWFVSINYYGIPSTEVWLPESEYDEAKIPDLVMEKGKDFKILVLSDIQLETDPRKDFRTIKFLLDIVNETKPDFITTTGDNASWYIADLETKRLIKKMESFGIPWSVTLGNHDSEGRADRNYTGNLYENAKNSLFRNGPSNIHGVGNYSINVKDSDGNIVYELIMLDSNEKRVYDTDTLKRTNGYVDDFIYRDQIEWYEWVVQGASKARYGEYDPQKGKVVPSMLFFHIPIPEFRDVEAAVAKGDPSATQIFGENRSGTYIVPVNTGLFDSVKKLNSTTDIFCGHDHQKSLSALYEGVRLTYGLKAGYSAHYDLDMVGGTVITIKDGSYKASVQHVYMTEK